jgi:hypothetical protein
MILTTCHFYFFTVASVENIPGAPSLIGPLIRCQGIDENTSSVTVRPASLMAVLVCWAVLGFLCWREGREGSLLPFDASIKGPAITHLTQVPLWECLHWHCQDRLDRAHSGCGAPPRDALLDSQWPLRADYVPGDIGFDPLSSSLPIRKSFRPLQTKELQERRLAMLPPLVSWPSEY